MSLTGKVLIGTTGLSAIAISVVCFPFVAPAFRKYCLPYVPASSNQIANVIKCLPKSKDRLLLLDIGSGDGRICIETAKRGFISHGVELNRWLVLFSRLSALRHGVQRNTKFFKKDLWKFDTSSYNCVVIFGVEQMMEDLEKKLAQELQAQSQIIACRFPFPNQHLKLTKQIDEGIDSVWVYQPRKL